MVIYVDGDWRDERLAIINLATWCLHKSTRPKPKRSYKKNSEVNLNATEMLKSTDRQHNMKNIRNLWCENAFHTKDLPNSMVWIFLKSMDSQDNLDSAKI